MGNIFSVSLSCDAIALRCWDSISGKEPNVRKLRENLQALDSSFQELRALNKDVKGRVEVAVQQPFMKRLEQVHNWISRADAVETEVNEVLSRRTQQVEKLCCGGYCSKNYWSSYKYGKEVAKMVKVVDDLNSRGAFAEVAAQILPAASANERPIEPTEGMELMLDKVWRHLEDEQVGKIGLYGMGGVGKTTLLTKIHNKLVHAKFDRVIWIVVSKDHTIDAVQEKIGKKIGLSTDNWKDKMHDEKADVISRVLTGKKFVLLLDDIWEPVEITKVGIPLPDNHNKSKIVFTTRSEDVCGHMRAQKKIKVECLAQDEAWRLFEKNVGQETLHIHPDILDLAKTVANECDGLPLALITVGRAMSCKKTPQEWNHAIRVLKNFASEFAGMGDIVLPLLKFSYDNLPSEKVKSCFLYCALFPEDFAIKKDELLYFWICEEMLEEKGSVDEAKDESYDILGTLISACLLEEEGSERVKMHDVVRDMALWLARDCGKENESILVHTRLHVAPEVQKWMKAERVSLMRNQFGILDQTPKSPNLLTLLLRGVDYQNKLTMIVDGFFDHMASLRVLDLSWNLCITQLPSGVSNLVSLQHLNLSVTGIRELPKELKALVQLKYLNLEFTRKLDFIPPNTISSFPKLKVLRMFECGSPSSNLFDGESGILEELQALKHINVLTVSVANPSCLPKLSSYPILVACTRRLHISDPKNQNSRSVDISSLVDMKRLGRLVIENCANLEELEICWAGRVPSDPQKSIMSNQNSFAGLHEFRVRSCKNLKDLTWLIFAPNLSTLSVSICLKMEKIIDLERLGGVENAVKELNPFAKLNRLILFKVPLLRSIYDTALPFPYLKHIRVRVCPELKKLPLNAISSAERSNLIIERGEKWWNGLEWEDEASRNVFRPCFSAFPQRVSSHR